MKTMKFKIIILALMFSSAMLNAQIPQAFSYQAIAMDSNGDLVTDSEVGIEISVLIGTPTGDNVYTESHLVMSTSLGHINLEVGRGTPVLGQFANVIWSEDAHFLEIKMDVAGGTDYQFVGTVQLLSVPFAFYAEESLSGIQGPIGPTGPIGPAGAQGPEGAPGPQGQAGTGIQGPQEILPTSRDHKAL